MLTITDTLRLANAFRRELREELGADKLAKIDADNAAETDWMVDHAHDCCDANQVMLDAFEKAFGREVDFDRVDDTDLTNAAWDRARRLPYSDSSEVQ